MKNEMTLDKTGLTIPGSELAECGMAGVDLSAQMTHSLLLLMPREMTALQTADALAGLFDAASQLVSALLDACRMPCCKDCDYFFHLVTTPFFMIILLYHRFVWIAMQCKKKREKLR